MGRTVSVGHDNGRPEMPHRASHPAAAETSQVRRSPAHTQVLVLKLFAPLETPGTVQIFWHKVMFVFVRLMGTSRADNEVANRGYPQVRQDFERAAEIARQLCVRETDHHQLVSWLTIMTASPATMVPRMGRKPLRPASTHWHACDRSLLNRLSSSRPRGEVMASTWLCHSTFQETHDT
jgi:hypothetical protein